MEEVIILSLMYSLQGDVHARLKIRFWYLLVLDGTVYKGYWHEGLKNQAGELYENTGRIYRTEYNKNTLLSKEDITAMMPRDSLRNFDI